MSIDLTKPCQFGFHESLFNNLKVILLRKFKEMNFIIGYKQNEKPTFAIYSMLIFHLNSIAGMKHLVQVRFHSRTLL